VEKAAHVAVGDPAGSYRRGLGAALSSAGFVVDEPDDLQEWVAGPQADAVLFTVRSANDWADLRDLLRLNLGVKGVALLVDPTADRHAESLRLGAHAAVAWDAAPERIASAVRCALEGDTLLPTEVAREIAVSGPPLHDPDWITAEETDWLRFLASGATVQQLAEKIGYSERALYRVLHGLYGRMRVSNRTEAILQASRWGLIAVSPTDGPPDTPSR